MSQQGFPAGGYGETAVPQHPQSQTAMILGIVSIAGGLTCLLPIFLSPLAWYLGAKSRREIQTEPFRWTGLSESSAGMILGIIGSVLLILGLVLLAAITSLIVIADSTSTY